MIILEERILPFQVRRFRRSRFRIVGFVRIHREHAVNLSRIRLLRLQADGRDWELKLEPPVNRVLSIARDRLAGLRTALGEPGD